MRQFYKSSSGEEVEAVKLVAAPEIVDLTELGERAGVGDYHVYDVSKRRWHYMSKAGFEAQFNWPYPALGRVVKSAAELEEERQARARLKAAQPAAAPRKSPK